LGRQAPYGLLGIHLSLLARAPGIVDQLPAKSAQERQRLHAMCGTPSARFPLLFTTSDESKPGERLTQCKAVIRRQNVVTTHDVPSARAL
jgi:hypothetical protein